MGLTDVQLVKHLLAFHESSMLHYRRAANLNRLTGARKDKHVSCSSQKCEFLTIFKQC